MTSIRILQKDKHYTPHEGAGNAACYTCSKFTSEAGKNICKQYIDEDDGGVVYLPNDFGWCAAYD